MKEAKATKIGTKIFFKGSFSRTLISSEIRNEAVCFHTVGEANETRRHFFQIGFQQLLSSFFCSNEIGSIICG